MVGDMVLKLLYTNLTINSIMIKVSTQKNIFFSLKRRVLEPAEATSVLHILPEMISKS